MKRKGSAISITKSRSSAKGRLNRCGGKLDEMKANLSDESSDKEQVWLSDEGKANCMMSMLLQLILKLDQMHDSGILDTRDLERNVSQLKKLMRIL